MKVSWIGQTLFPCGNFASNECCLLRWAQAWWELVHWNLVYALGVTWKAGASKLVLCHCRTWNQLHFFTLRLVSGWTHEYTSGIFILWRQMIIKLLVYDEMLILTGPPTHCTTSWVPHVKLLFQLVWRRIHDYKKSLIGPTLYQHLTNPKPSRPQGIPISCSVFSPEVKELRDWEYVRPRPHTTQSPQETGWQWWRNFRFLKYNLLQNLSFIPLTFWT